MTPPPVKYSPAANDRQLAGVGLQIASFHANAQATPHHDSCKSLQSVTGKVVDAMQHANLGIEQLEDIAESDFVCVKTRRVQMIDAARAAGVHIENDDMPDMKVR